jgi:hypothetical protein
MPASQAGRRGFDPRRLIAIIPICNAVFEFKNPLEFLLVTLAETRSNAVHMAILDTVVIARKNPEKCREKRWEMNGKKGEIGGKRGEWRDVDLMHDFSWLADISRC